MSIIKLPPYILDSTLDFTFNNVTATGNLVSLNANLGNLASANYVSGNGSLLSGLNGANITGNVGNATHAYVADAANSVAGANVTGQVANALVAGTVLTAAQPNITSTGTLTSVTVSGDGSIGGNLTITGNLTISGTQTTVNSTTVNINDINIVLANNASSAVEANSAGITINGAGANIVYLSTPNAFSFSHKISADGQLLSNITGANVTGFVPNANVANTAYSVAGANVVGAVQYATVANSVGVANVTGIGNIATINKDGNASNILYGNGVFAAAPSGGGGGGSTTLDGLTDVTITTPTNNQVLSYDSANSIWVNKTASSGGAGASVSVDTTPPSSPSEGDLWLDSESGELNVYFGDAWASVTESAPQLTSTVDSFVGDSLTTQFTLSTTPSGEAYTLVAIGGILQPRNTYTVSGNVLTTSSAVPSNTPIEVTTLGGFASPIGAASVVTNNEQPNITSTGTLTGLNVNGNVSITGNLTVNNAAPATTGKAIAMAIVFGF